MKTCFKCNQTKPLSEFYTHPRMADGHLGKCKECSKVDVAARIERKKLDPKWMAKERARCREKMAACRANGIDYNHSHETGKKWSRNNRHKSRAQNKARRAMLRGVILKPKTCSRCGASGRIEMHHADYSKPLAVEWLCCPCHGKTRRKID